MSLFILSELLRGAGGMKSRGWTSPGWGGRMKAIGRRQFLKASGLGLGTLALSALLAEEGRLALRPKAAGSSRRGPRSRARPGA